LLAWVGGRVAIETSPLSPQHQAKKLLVMIKTTDQHIGDNTEFADPELFISDPAFQKVSEQHPFPEIVEIEKKSNHFCN
jgi:hypothetical protein